MVNCSKALKENKKKCPIIREIERERKRDRESACVFE